MTQDFQSIVFTNEELKSMKFETPILRYTKSELAQLYKHSVGTLMNWIKKEPHLLKELVKTGYQNSQKEFKKEQVKLIFAYLGEP